jgi:hypothetical protein
MWADYPPSAVSSATYLSETSLIVTYFILYVFCRALISALDQLASAGSSACVYLPVSELDEATATPVGKVRLVQGQVRVLRTSGAAPDPAGSGSKLLEGRWFHHRLRQPIPLAWLVANRT